MELCVGQKVAYPNQGVCLVEDIERKTIGENSMSFYALRVLRDGSVILVPIANAAAVGIRPVITSRQYRLLKDKLAEDFEEVSDPDEVKGADDAEEEEDDEFGNEFSDNEGFEDGASDKEDY